MKSGLVRSPGITRAEPRRTGPWVAGVDGYRGGWFVALWDRASRQTRWRCAVDFAALLDLPEAPEVIAIDIPIGLLDRAQPGGRACDRAARALLRPHRAGSVFSPPTRSALEQATYAEALAANRATSAHGVGLSRQCFHLFPKLREVDRRMTPGLQDRVMEAHPELAFRESRGRPMDHPKRTAAGRIERRTALDALGLHPPEGPIRDRFGVPAQVDDILDAFVLAWTAERIAQGQAQRLPSQPERDARGLRMEIWR